MLNWCCQVAKPAISRRLGGERTQAETVNFDGHQTDPNHNCKLVITLVVIGDVRIAVCRACVWGFVRVRLVMDVMSICVKVGINFYTCFIASYIVYS